MYRLEGFILGNKKTRQKFRLLVEWADGDCLSALYPLRLHKTWVRTPRAARPEDQTDLFLEKSSWERPVTHRRDKASFQFSEEQNDKPKNTLQLLSSLRGSQRSFSSPHLPLPAPAHPVSPFISANLSQALSPLPRPLCSLNQFCNWIPAPSPAHRDHA